MPMSADVGGFLALGEKVVVIRLDQVSQDDDHLKISVTKSRSRCCRSSILTGRHIRPEAFIEPEAALQLDRLAARRQLFHRASGRLEVGAELAGEILRDLCEVARLALRDGPHVVWRLLHGHGAAQEPDIELLALAELLAAHPHQRGLRLDDAERDALGVGAQPRHGLSERQGGSRSKPNCSATTAAQSVSAGARLILIVSAMPMPSVIS